MDTAVQVAIIGALFTFFAAIIATLMNYYRERSERERWQRTLELEREKWQRALELEQQRLRHEKVRWALELNNQRETELHKMRLRVYPEVLASLGRLSGLNIDRLTEAEVLELADKFDEYGYGEAGICMLPDTRDAIFALRRDLLRFAKKEISAKDIRGGTRTDLIELLRRDANHDWSRWRDFKSLIEVNRERIDKVLVDI